MIQEATKLIERAIVARDNGKLGLFVQISNRLYDNQDVYGVFGIPFTDNVLRPDNCRPIGRLMGEDYYRSDKYNFTLVRPALGTVPAVWEIREK